jgi:cell wall-associated NlpC family hydrolase/prophage tail gpP-like protein
MISVRALITAEIGRRGYREFPSTSIEAFAIDTAMDSDSDSFSIDLGSPTPELKFLVDRDNEVRATIFTDSPRAKNVTHLSTGIADVVSYSSEDHVISIAGRDISSVATDSQAPPGEFRKLRPDVFVKGEASALGFTRMKLARVTGVEKFYRDGSESYWESWYRIYRNRKMWIWQEPDGTLIADKLNYAVSPTYFFGIPTKTATRQGWIPVEKVTITKDTQRRSGEVWVFGERGDLGFVAQATDPSVRSWKKRPIKIVTSTDAKNRSEALVEAWEEIFEGKVGALELSVTIPFEATGRLVRQNYMAELNVPDMGLHGIFFIVGVRLIGGPQGYIQEVRLREKNYAISRRVPSDPILEADPADDILPGDVGAGLRQTGIRWANSFASAAQEFHDGWPYDLFLGILLAICDKETSFRNVPESGDTEWYPKPTSGSGTGAPGAPGAAQGMSAVEQWRREFANQPGTVGNPFDRERGVGPFQLTTRGYKEWADDYGGKSDEFEGGRWIPQANIRAAARAFAGKLSGLDPQKPDQIWIGVQAYNGAGTAAVRYRDSVKAIWNTRYRGLTEDIEASGNSVPEGDKTDVVVTDATGARFPVKMPNNAPDDARKFVNYLIRQIGKPYEWGASGPASFDCSGLIIGGANSAGGDARRLFANSSRPTTYSIASNTSLKKVNKDNLISGDLVLFASGGDIHHVGIYLNDGHFIHAPHTGDVVKISPLNSPYYRDSFYGARRLFDWYIPFVTDFGG